MRQAKGPDHPATADHVKLVPKKRDNWQLSQNHMPIARRALELSTAITTPIEVRERLDPRGTQPTQTAEESAAADMPNNERRILHPAS